VPSVVANATVGAVAVAAWPFMYFMGYGIAAQFGWIVADPTVTDDWVSVLIGAGIVAIVVVAGAFAALNGAIGLWTRIPAARWIPRRNRDRRDRGVGLWSLCGGDPDREARAERVGVAPVVDASRSAGAVVGWRSGCRRGPASE
jgi:hypothetical protein